MKLKLAIAQIWSDLGYMEKAFAFLWMAWAIVSSDMQLLGVPLQIATDAGAAVIITALCLQALIAAKGYGIEAFLTGIYAVWATIQVNLGVIGVPVKFVAIIGAALNLAMLAIQKGVQTRRLARLATAAAALRLGGDV